MDSKIIVRILIVGLTTVLTLIVFTEKDFLKDAQIGWEKKEIK